MVAIISPDCNLLDYYMLDTVQREDNTSTCKTKDELIATIMTDFTNINKETFQKSYSIFRSYLEAGVEANGDFSEISTLPYFKIFL